MVHIMLHENKKTYKFSVFRITMTYEENSVWFEISMAMLIAVSCLFITLIKPTAVLKDVIMYLC